ncbi:hypothetical protein JX265_002603 [Neoarthrinium moseri]|uniref:DUF1295-domain-containing protein n=1 Tax=Neoarthrinium moseri TaxID=1658444 RepID=A0A9P9WUR7_9PEZI|nr:uncharacterized protein JN550_000416 [Neoarthrinium moseri]KAI1854965.1 hypothetical protein JX266_001083 [Neoarthrinium moseri]KAI1878234.1 hypothetical protein JN550_000416 [Neoarthrinium moseri]KAI1879649.1 hypothetical protein JX265_002603 [Neoarthrinium moseri]
MSNPDLDRHSLLGGRTVQFNVSTSTPYYSDAPSSAPGPLETRLPGHENSVPHYHEAWHRELFDVGIFKDTILPSLTLHAPLALVAYGIGRATDSVEAKDWLWPTAPIANAWWSAVGRKVRRGLTFGQAMSLLSRPERLLLTGVTLWGGRLLYRRSTRSLARRKAGKGTDDPRYEELKQDPNFWNTALFTVFIPEALLQTVITLPFTAPFHHQGKVISGYHPLIQGIAVGIFSAGLALEIIADSQLTTYKETVQDEKAICKEGVWSLVRHPNYLGDALVHFSFPLLLYGSDLLAPIEILGSIANYIFLRYISGAKKTEAHQERRYSQSSLEKHADFQKFKASHNSIWPRSDMLTNKWLWTVIGIGAAGAAVEQVINQLI